MEEGWRVCIAELYRVGEVGEWVVVVEGRAVGFGCVRAGGDESRLVRRGGGLPVGGRTWL